MSYKALVIGCGNIGAEYDLYNDEVLTHAKAFSLNKNIKFCIADKVLDKAKKISKKYNTSYYTDLSDEDLKKFDIISLCINTKYHFEYLKRISQLNMPFLISEKPIVASLKEINDLKKLNIDPDKVLINYIRRFQPSYFLLKKRLKKILKKEKINNVVIKYNRGILNNGSHAFDLLFFLLDRDIILDKFDVLAKEYDAFDFDPTITGSFLLDEISVMVVGFVDTSYSIFELEIYTTNWKVVVVENGETIQYFKNKNGELFEIVAMRQENGLKNYMLSVVDTALQCMKGQKKTNFDSAIKVNEEILKLIEKIK